MPTRTVRIALALPVELLAAVDQAIRAGHARSRNELVTMALRRELAAQQRTTIDAAFAAMAEDPTYQTEAQVMQVVDGCSSHSRGRATFGALQRAPTPWVHADPRYGVAAGGWCRLRVVRSRDASAKVLFVSLSVEW
jgi:hypothetical protein